MRLELWKPKNTVRYVMKKDICLRNHEAVWEGAPVPTLGDPDSARSFLGVQVRKQRGAAVPPALPSAVPVPPGGSADPAGSDGSTREEQGWSAGYVCSAHRRALRNSQVRPARDVLATSLSPVHTLCRLFATVKC